LAGSVCRRAIRSSSCQRTSEGDDHGQAADHPLPSGEQLVVLPRCDYEDLVDALAARKVEAALAAGREELLTAEKTAALVAAPMPLAFRRNQRGKTQSQLAAEIGVSQNFLSDLERGKAKGDMTLYGELARCLRLRIVDLAPDGD
jgi:DNA-binding XRE family transcriptional regulator